MARNPTSDTKLDSQRRPLLKLTGASVAVGSLGLKIGLAHADTSTSDAGDRHHRRRPGRIDRSLRPALGGQPVLRGPGGEGSGSSLGRTRTRLSAQAAE